MTKDARSGRHSATRPSFAEPVREDEQFPGVSDPGVKLIAYYLPQFHPIPENDRWWGKGFTEWTNVAKAKPLFSGHHQPHLPGELGFYDLRVPEVMQRQVELARQYGLSGFCFYYYWFGGTRLLEKPLDMFLEHPEWEFPFCLCWANENWTRRWDGQNHEVLIAQTHSAEDDLACVKDIARYLRDPRYIRIEGKPLLVVYRVNILPDARATAERWRAYCRDAGLGEIMLVAAQSFGITDPRPFGFDAAVEFPPHGITSRSITSEVRGLDPGFRGKIYSYPEIAARNPPSETPYPHFKAVCGAWDNTARRGLSSTVFGRATPQAYQQWLQQVIEFTQRYNAPEHRFVFINAWNEWAEGAHLEPDSTWGYGYLNATARALLASEVSAPRLEMKRQQTAVEEGRVSIIVPAYNHERYIHEALDSIRQQRLAGLKSEVIVVDDGSSDGTAAKVELYKTLYPSFDIQLIQQRNAGAHAAINTGIEASRGSYIAILNSDDQYHPERICLLYEAMEKSGGPLCFSDLEFIDDDSNSVNENDAYVHHIRDNLRRIKTFPSLGYALLTFNSAVSTGNLFFSREVFDRIGGFKKLRYCHDWDFVLSALEFGTPVRVSKRLYRYRLHANNTFSSLGQMAGHEESRIVLHKAARRILSASSSDAFPLLTESRKYLLDLLAHLGHPLEEQDCPKAA